MTVSVSSPTDVANLALAHIGYKLRIGSLFDGSPAAKTILDVYAQTRDELLVQQDWLFAERNTNMTLLKQAPTNGYGTGGWNSSYPSPPWFFSYEYPSDCLKVRCVKPQPVDVISFDPQPHTFSVENDKSYSPPKKVILCNVQNALLTYTGQVTAPSDWVPMFVETFATTLGRIIAPRLLDLEHAKYAAAEEAMTKAIADATQG